MHPILGRIDRLAAYLAVWLSAGVLIAGVFTRFGLGWVEALVFLAPLFLVYAFVCLSAWYVSRASPLTTTSSVLRVLVSSVLASMFASGLWLGVTNAWIAALTGETVEQMEHVLWTRVGSRVKVHEHDCWAPATAQHIAGRSHGSEAFPQHRPGGHAVG